MACEIDQIKRHIEEGKNFLLSGGAGSGKTHSLMETLDFLFSRNNRARVASITFTNVAVNEIRNRAPYKQLWASTIHEFLWASINAYQKELKKSLVELIEKEKHEAGTGIKYKGDLAITEEYLSDKNLEYKDWLKIEDGTVSHDEVLKLANHMFEKHPLLCKILKDKYNFILIDEYQDTEKQVIEIFLKYLQNEKNGKCLIGLFGDSMQSIYDRRVGDIKEYVTEGLVNEVIKPDNWRCSNAVITLINKIRDDGIIQEASGDNIEGAIAFLYSNSEEINIEDVKKHPAFTEWAPSDTAKELYLTHRLISKKAGFETLFEIYDKDRIIEHIQKIKDELKKYPEKEDSIAGKTFGEVLDLKIAKEGKPYAEFIIKNRDLFEATKGILFEDLRKIYLNKDQLVEGGSEKKEGRGDKKDDLIKHLSRIQKCIYLYDNNLVHDFLRLTEFKIRSASDKRKLKEIMEEIRKPKEKTIEDIINYADAMGIVRKDDNLKDFIREKKYVFDRVRQVKFSEFICLFNYEEGFSPYSTQHGIKGAEFDNVFVVLDNGEWKEYNFEYLFTNRTDKESIIKRTRRIFYACCSRTKKNLIVYYHKPSSSVVEMAKLWFGEKNVIQI
jgi:DNA helicase-2/ATP-dependent DNA helicase PcrA